MEALIVIDAQNEFSPDGKRSIPNHSTAVDTIRRRVEQARQVGRPIAWIRHHNKPSESPAFKPGSWGAEFLAGFGPQSGRPLEVEFQKVVYGAFTGTEIGSWLKEVGAEEVMLVGFYTHACLSTTAREAIMRDLTVSVDPSATGTCDMYHELLGKQTAEEVCRSTLLQPAHMGARITPFSGNKD